jgi:hypothetical protein
MKLFFKLMHQFEFIQLQFPVVAQGGVGDIHLVNGVAL